MQTLPRPEHPRPQFERTDWINLNGPWSCAIDHSNSGQDKGWKDSKGFDLPITVPFCPESTLSGVGYTDFIEHLWYHRTIEIPANWSGSRVLLHFGAVDYAAAIYLDGVEVGRNWGGSCGFSLDITQHVHPDTPHNVVVQVSDHLRSWFQPSGKQCMAYASFSCHYTRTTGIWQTVWLERVNQFGLRDCAITADLDNKRFCLVPSFYAIDSGCSLHIRALLKGRVCAQASSAAVNGCTVQLTPDTLELWEPGNPALYDLVLEVLDSTGTVIDTVHSYAGMRKMHIENNQVMLNNHPLYQRLVLDQGFYPDGIWTAPTDEALKRDIELSLQAGFNGARLHQKVFEERFHYWADRLGYLTWAESPSWGLNLQNPEGARNFLAEWGRIVKRDRNHPSIIAWTPFNETDPRTGDDLIAHNRLVKETVDLTRTVDPTRPVNDCSGWVHVDTDLWTVHDYSQSAAELDEHLRADEVFRNRPQQEPPYRGQPYIVDEFGGIKWICPERRAFATNSWGYGNEPKTIDEFYTRLEEITRALLSNKRICGYCYTQLTDVEQEQNGIYHYDRTPKFDMNLIKTIFSLTPQ